MKQREEILAQPTGAKFYRADLHIHSYGASHDVKDSTMTADAIVATAIAQGLSIISITDHNEIGNVQKALEAAAANGLCIIPGIELSTPQGHLLCYLPTLEALQRLHGQVTIVDRGQRTSRCQQSILECLSLTEALGGFGVLAHVDAASGYEVEVTGASPHKFDVICHKALLGIELKHSSSVIRYGEGDPDADRVRIGRDRITRLGLGAGQWLARVLNSDAHALSMLGRNASNDTKVTRYKMEAPSFNGLRVALQDADARVRIEDLVPASVPVILGVQLDGGFLSGQVIQFNGNLNCLIGGRGTGKSTVFEAIRCLVGNPSESQVVDSEVWPEELFMLWKDRAGQTHALGRTKDGQLRNHDDPILGPCAFDIDCFGQGDAARISLESQKNPLALLSYLDKFVDLKLAVDEEETAREELLSLQTEIEKAELNVAQIPQYERLLSTTQQQLAALQKPEVKELINLQRELASEKELRVQIQVKLQDAKKSVGTELTKSVIEEIKDMASPSELSVGAPEFKAIQEGAEVFEGVVQSAANQVSASLKDFEATVALQFTNWKAKETESHKKLDEKRRELEALKVPFDMSYISKLAKDEASHAQSVKVLKTWKPHLQELQKKRASVLKRRWEARTKIAMLRNAFGRKATDTLGEALTDLQVSLKYSENAYSPDAASQIIQAMGWRTNQQGRASWLVERLTLPVLLTAIGSEDAGSILALRTPEGVQVFQLDEARDILEKLRQPAVKFALERAAIHDLPRLRVTRMIPDGSGGSMPATRDFSNLSLGQKQSVLLALILSSDSDKPLIIDQPEDNLDGEFIYKTLVPVLRRAKERRQVIVVTHNANVAVLGDAEQLLIMKANSDKGVVVARGSIDEPQIRDFACGILEGARDAFAMRARMYGIRLA
ncbi:MAG: AAA family ATPase [Flavobacteriales bacterium]|nr:AAA family ATPase [Flavobacteriales bacterium]